LDIELRNVSIGRVQSALLAPLLALAIDEEQQANKVSAGIDLNHSLTKCCMGFDLVNRKDNKYKDLKSGFNLTRLK